MPKFRVREPKYWQKILCSFLQQFWGGGENQKVCREWADMRVLEVEGRGGGVLKVNMGKAAPYLGDIDCKTRGTDGDGY